MRLLLDTHALLWWHDAPERLSADARAVIADPLNDVLMSVASLWEIQIKLAVKRLDLQRPLGDLARIEEGNGFVLLPITLGHVLALGGLPLHHRDPFDRLLVAQARAEGGTLVSRDAAFAAYNVPVLW